METASSAIEQLIHLSNDPQMFALVFGPLLILVIIAVVFFFFYLIKKRKEETLLATDSVLSADDEDTEGQFGSEEATTELPAADRSAAQKSADVAEIQSLDQETWLGKLRSGLGRTRENFLTNVAGLFAQRSVLSEEQLGKIHESLFRADVGVATTDSLVEGLKKNFSGNTNIGWPDIRDFLKRQMVQILSAPDHPFKRPKAGPWVILIVGVNGAGKTTTVAKLAATMLAEDRSVLLAAADTFRAAAIEQLQVWGARLGVEVIAHRQGSDPAAVAYDAVKAALARQSDVLIIDTAGRLHNKKELMDELSKVKRVIGKDLVDAPHEVWLVIDATTGQNALQQIKTFNEAVELTGLVVTKLDGTAKGGILVAACDQFKLPIQYIGVGEKVSDLRRFNAVDFVNSIL